MRKKNRKKGPYTLKPEYTWNKGQENKKPTLKELMDLKKYCEENIFSPYHVITKEIADQFNETEERIRKMFPTYKGHHWKVGDKAYILSVRGDIGLLGARKNEA